MKKALGTWHGIVIPWLALTALTAACSAAGSPAVDRENERRSMKITAIDFEWDAVPEHGIGLNMINERFQVDYRPAFYLADRYYDKLVSVLTSNRIPDIISFPNDSLKFIQFAKQGLFLPLNDYIDTYSTFKAVPPAMYERFSVNGNIYGIPQYYPSYNITPIIRKDWLDNLGLSMPTNFEELKQVAIAFTRDDPDGNGRDDTYGIVTGRNYYPEYDFGAYWDSAAWLHKNEAGDYIPGSVSEGFKQQIATMAELYAEGALAENFPFMTWNQLNEEFYSGKAGIYIGSPNGMIQELMKQLVAADPEAEVVPVPPFTDPNGRRGFLATEGFIGITALSGNLSGNSEKIETILEMIDFGRRYYSLEELTPDNPDFDWYMGYVGQGYDYVHGKIVAKENSFSQGLAPVTFFVDSFEWVPEDKIPQYHKRYIFPQTAELSERLEQMWTDSDKYISPLSGTYSPAHDEKGAALHQWLRDEQIKIILGLKPLEEWDDLVAEYMRKGGSQMIKEFNQEIRQKERQDYWE